MKILVVGAGPVGLSTAIRLIEKGLDVSIVDINSAVVEQINNRQVLETLVNDKIIEHNIICLTTADYSDYTHLIWCARSLNFTDLEDISNISCAGTTLKVIIRTTIDHKVADGLSANNFIFWPEWLEENKSLAPSHRNIVGSNEPLTADIIKIVGNDYDSMPVVDAALVKVWANVALAEKINSMNYIASQILLEEPKTKTSMRDIVKKIYEDKRLGVGYDKISVGWGGKCLIKDTALVDALSTIDANHDIKFNISDRINGMIYAYNWSNKTNINSICFAGVADKPNHYSCEFSPVKRFYDFLENSHDICTFDNSVNHSVNLNFVDIPAGEVLVIFNTISNSDLCQLALCNTFKLILDFTGEYEKCFTGEYYDMWKSYND